MLHGYHKFPRLDFIWINISVCSFENIVIGDYTYILTSALHIKIRHILTSNVVHGTSIGKFDTNLGVSFNII